MNISDDKNLLNSTAKIGNNIDLNNKENLYTEHIDEKNDTMLNEELNFYYDMNEEEKEKFKANIIKIKTHLKNKYHQNDYQVYPKLKQFIKNK